MLHKPRVFISSTLDINLDDRRRRIKREIIRMISDAEMASQIFMEAGLPEDKTWNFKTVQEVMEQCQGAVILGFTRWHLQTEKDVLRMPSEYNHFEGALALAQGLPTLAIAEQGMPERGVFNTGNQIITYIPEGEKAQWLKSEYFQLRFNAWRKSVSSRPEVFFGYSSAARETANPILNYLRGRLGVEVLEYGTGFQSGGTILEEIEKAAHRCLCGIFLFTCDDPLSDDKERATPRDNVIFEAGYFMKAKGKERTLIIREEGAKMPADLGGNIYLTLKDRSNTNAIHDDLRFFLETRA